jgi:ribonuclease P protein component
MKKNYRLKTKKEIDLVFKQRKTTKNEFFSVHYKHTPDQLHFRYGISIGRKYGNAVSRNLIKRRIRMIVLEHKQSFLPEMQFIIVVSPKASVLNYQDIKTQLKHVFKKITE